MKRGIALLLCVLLAVGFAACATPTPTTAPATQAPETQAATAAPAETTAAATEAAPTTAAADTSAPDALAYEKYDPPIDVTSVRTIPNPATVNYLNGDSAENNEWTRLYKDRLGINLKYMWMVDASQWIQKLNLAISSGDIPDVFQVSMVQMYQLNDAGLIQDVGEVFNKYCSAYTMKVMTESGDAQIKSATINGKMMAIPYTGLPKETGPVLMLRSDWLDKLGLQAPKKFDDLVNILNAFVKNDPDGNGQADTVGLVMDKTLAVNAALANCFHAYPGNWIPDASGKAVFGSIQPEMKNYLTKLAQLYADGVLDKEFGSKDSTKAIEPLINGKAGVYTDAFWAPLYPWQSLFNNNTSAKIGYYLMPSTDDQPAKLYSPLGTIGYWVVNKNMQHPEAVVKMMNVWTDVFYANTDPTIYGTLVNRADGTEVWQNALIQTYRGFKNYDEYKHVTAAYQGKMSTSELTGDENGVLERVKKFDAGDNTMWAWKQIYCPGGIFEVVEQYITNNWFIDTPYLGPPTQTELDKGTVLSDMASQEFIKIITGAVPASDFDNFVTQWKSAGGDQWTQEINDAMAKQ